MGKINSRQKGARGEREFARLLREYGFESAHRGRQFCGSPESPDVVCHELDEWHFEAKWTERLELGKAMQQAIEDCGHDQKPAVASKKNRRPIYITTLATDWLERERRIASLRSEVVRLLGKVKRDERAR